jgi:hypothetical protein
MTYSLISSVRNSEASVLHTYNINCQFVRYFWERFMDLPKFLQDGMKIPQSNWQHLIPKMHLMGHTCKCQAPYSLNFAAGAARTCGESIERMWAATNGIAKSVQEMGAGMRTDYMDPHLRFHNHRKVLRDGKPEHHSLL